MPHNNNMQLLGDSRDKKLVKLVFGGPEQFQAEIDKRGNNFYFKEHQTIVSFDKEEEVYQFYCN